MMLRRWAELSDMAARDRAVSPERAAKMRAFFQRIPDKDAVYVMRNETVANVLHRLADMFAHRATLSGEEFDNAITPAVLDPTEPQ